MSQAHHHPHRTDLPSALFAAARLAVASTQAAVGGRATTKRRRGGKRRAKRRAAAKAPRWLAHVRRRGLRAGTKSTACGGHKRAGQSVGRRRQLVRTRTICCSRGQPLLLLLVFVLFVAAQALKWISSDAVRPQARQVCRFLLLHLHTPPTHTWNVHTI